MPDIEREFNEARERLNAIIRYEGNPEIRRSFASDSRVLRRLCVAGSYQAAVGPCRITVNLLKSPRKRM